MSYALLAPDTVAAYIASVPHLAALVDPATLEVREIGDGNLNLVFVCRDRSGHGVVLKQSLPYVRLVGESWPLSPLRIVAESRGYEAATKYAAGLVPEYFGLDPERHVIAMEDLSSWTVWRTALNEGRISPAAAEAMGRYVARIAFHTSVFGLSAEAVKQAAALAINPELCRITEDLVFTEPYIDHAQNSWHPAIEDAVLSLRSGGLTDEVASLKHCFMTTSEALIHGDLHTGSVMVPRGDRVGAKAIDIEFAFYGPVAFDLGALFGNYLIAQARAAVLDREQGFRRWLDGQVAETWTAFEGELRSLWPQRVDRYLSDAFLDRWLASVWSDAVGFGGCKAIRRIVGLAKVSDIETLPEPEHVRAARMVLESARRWIESRGQIATPDGLAELTAESLAPIRR